MSAIKYLNPLSAFVKSNDPGSKSCESMPFKLQCYYSTAFLLGSSILLGAFELLGNPIQCITTLPKKVINNYCWMANTFTMDDYSNREIGTQAVAPGVFTPEDFDDRSIQEKWTFHNYYQWVIFFLFGMAGLSFLPKLIWTLCEGDVIRSLTMNLTQGIYDEKIVIKRKKEVVNYFLGHIKLHNFYVGAYFVCEGLCIMIVVLETYFFNLFLGGEFYQYGFNVIKFADLDQVERVDPMIYIFPRMTKCIFHLFGTSGTLERKDAYCLLPQNMLNEKIFISIWFWHMILISTFLVLIPYRLAMIFSPAIRLRILKNHIPYVSDEVLNTIINKSSIGDWWIFYQLSLKIEGDIYRDILCTLAEELEKKDSGSREQLNHNSNGYVAHGSAYNGAPNVEDRRAKYPMYPNPHTHLASAPPAGYVQSSV